MEQNYSDKFTLGGRLTPSNRVTEAGVAKTKALLEKAMRGDRIANAILESTATTSDLKFDLAYLTNANVIPQFDKAPRVWNQIAGVRTVPDFRPAVLYSLFGDFTGAGIRKGGGAPRIPEGQRYPHVTITGQESQAGGLHKNGLAFDYTWEARINDAAGFFSGLPGEITDVAVDTEEAEVFDALALTGDNRALQGGTLPDGTTVVKNAKLTPSAIWQAILELSTREHNGRKIGTVSKYSLVVPTGEADFINFLLSQPVIRQGDGANDTYVLGPGDRSLINRVNVVEATRLKEGEWYVLPAPGTLRRPVLELLRLRGNEAPQIRVRDNGVESYEDDSLGFRLRYPCGGVLWDDEFVLKSNSTGA